MSSTSLIQTNEISQPQIELWKRTYCKGASDDELKLFVSTCQRTGLSPEGRQIYMVPRWDGKLKTNVLTPQTSIDGFRVIAERSGHYQGQVGPFFTDDGQWTDVWLKPTYPKAAKVGVIRDDFKEPLWAVARWDSYVQTTHSGQVTIMWNKMADIMLAKCAEALALRKAFPQDLSGLYTSDEMGHIDIEPHIVHAPIPSPIQAAVASKQQKIFDRENPQALNWMKAKLEERHLSSDEHEGFLDEMQGKDILTEFEPLLAAHLERLKND